MQSGVARDLTTRLPANAAPTTRLSSRNVAHADSSGSRRAAAPRPAARRWRRRGPARPGQGLSAAQPPSALREPAGAAPWQSAGAGAAPLPALAPAPAAPSMAAFAAALLPSVSSSLGSDDEEEEDDVNFRYVYPYSYYNASSF